MMETTQFKNIDDEFDTSQVDANNVMRGSQPTKLTRLEKCCYSLQKNNIEDTDTDTLERYALRYKISADKLKLIYRYTRKED